MNSRNGKKYSIQTKNLKQNNQAITAAETQNLDALFQNLKHHISGSSEFNRVFEEQLSNSLQELEQERINSS